MTCTPQWVYVATRKYVDDQWVTGTYSIAAPDAALLKTLREEPQKKQTIEQLLAAAAEGMSPDLESQLKATTPIATDFCYYAYLLPDGSFCVEAADCSRGSYAQIEATDESGRSRPQIAAAERDHAAHHS